MGLDTSSIHAARVTAMLPIERTFDPAVVNAVSNHYSIFPHICCGRKEPIDVSEQIKDENNIYLAGEWGVAVFHYCGQGQFEAHYRVLPAGRGKWSLTFVLLALQWMFCHETVREIRCRVPRGNYACRALIRRICAYFVYTEPKGWIDEDGNIIEADVFSMTRERWETLTRTKAH